MIRSVLSPRKRGSQAAELIDLAADYYAHFPDEIDSRIAADARAAEELRALADRRQRLLSV